MVGMRALLRATGVVLRQEWHWFMVLTVVWVVVFATGPCHRSAGSVADRDPQPTITAPLSQSAGVHVPVVT